MSLMTRSIAEPPTDVITESVLFAWFAPVSASQASATSHGGVELSKPTVPSTTAVFVNGVEASSFTCTWMVIDVDAPTPNDPGGVHVTTPPVRDPSCVHVTVGGHRVDEAHHARQRVLHRPTRVGGRVADVRGRHGVGERVTDRRRVLVGRLLDRDVWRELVDDRCLGR